MSVDRGFTWMDDETIALIDIFSKSDVQEELRGAKRNIVVYERIAGELSDIGFTRTAYQCREKIKRLRKEYQHNKYCFQNNITPKKPMKYFELVDKVFNKNIPSQNVTEVNLLSSENEEELHCTLNADRESDASNSFIDSEQIPPQSILPGPSCLGALDNENSNMLLDINLSNSPSITQTDSDNILLLNNDEEQYSFTEKDASLDDIDSPWVPNVVLVENDDTESISENLNGKIKENLQEFKAVSMNESDLKDEPPQKKRKYESTQDWVKQILDNVTENFLNYQESAESRFLDRITQLEQERMKRDEYMQKLMLEFEERRRKEEQQHELKMLSLLGKFINQMNGRNDHESS